MQYCSNACLSISLTIWSKFTERASDNFFTGVEVEDPPVGLLLWRLLPELHPVPQRHLFLRLPALLPQLLGFCSQLVDALGQGRRLPVPREPCIDEEVPITNWKLPSKLELSGSILYDKNYFSKFRILFDLWFKKIGSEVRNINSQEGSKNFIERLIILLNSIYSRLSIDRCILDSP